MPIAAPAPSPAPSTGISEPTGITYSGPIRITRGGTYTGNWQSTDPNVPAVTIATGEPVVIDRANIRSAGHLIQGFGGNVTVRNSYGRALNPNVGGRSPGRFFMLEDFVNVVVENNDFENTSGMYLRRFTGNPAAGHGIRVVGNRARNIEGRHSNGGGGFTSSYDLRHFLQFNDVRDVPGVEIAWNEVINQPRQSRVEDNISMFGSSGTASSPIRIHNNYIQGAYPENIGGAYNGGGILVGEGGSSIGTVPAFIWAYDNHIVQSMGHGIAISSGRELRMFRNRVINSGLLADGTVAASTSTVGIYVWDWQGTGGGLFFNNQATDNAAGAFVRTGSGLVRNDYFIRDCSANGNVCANNSSIPGTVDRAMEAAERERWRQKASTAGVRVGRQ